MQLNKLNGPQKKAVLTVEGPVLVLAGAGSGKTGVITHRIAWLLEKKIPAHAILAVTFTNKAAGEMKERVRKLAGARAKDVTVSTFHAFGAQVLREHISLLGWPKRFAIADMGDQLSMIRRAMKERSIDDRAFDGRKVLAEISKAKNTGKPPEPKPEGQGDDYDLISAEVFPLYQRALAAQGAVDFDDLLVLPVRIFEEHPHVLAQYCERYRYLLVDEFQDTNRTQMRLLQLLAGTTHNVCAVGDDDQCIYSWRGAEVRNLLDFERAFPGTREVKLEQNYRSTQSILDAAHAVIAKNPERKFKKLFTDRLGGPTIGKVAAADEHEEARFVSHEIAKAISQGLPPSEIAVLYRTNGQSLPIEESLREKNISYEVIGGSEFFDRREVKDVIAYIKAIANPRDEIALLRIVNVPARGIGDVTMERLLQHAREHKKPLWDVMRAPEIVSELSLGTAEKVRGFSSMLERYRTLFRQGEWAQVSRNLLSEIGFAEAARAKQLKSVDSLIDSLHAHQQRDVKADLLGYLNLISLDTRPEEDAPSGNRVRLMTLHAAKGLEFRLVFLIGMEEDLLPHAGMQGEPQNLEEERRLCYVGMTRSKDKLYLTRASFRHRRGKDIPRTPSRFLEDIPAELVESIDLTAPAAGPPTEREKHFFSNLKERLKAQGTTGA